MSTSPSTPGPGSAPAPGPPARRRRRRSRRPATARPRSTSRESPSRMSAVSRPSSVAVVPLPQVGVEHGRVPEAGEPRGLGGPRERDWSARGRSDDRRAAARARGPAPARRRSGARRSARCGGRVAPTRSRRGGPARPAVRPGAPSAPAVAAGPVTRRAASSECRAAASAGSAAKKSRGRQPKIAARSVRRDLRDARVVAIDLVVVELATVRDHPLEPLDLVLQVGDVRRGLDLRVALDRREQRPHGGARLLGRRRPGRGSARSGRRRPRGRASPRSSTSCSKAISAADGRRRAPAAGRGAA